MEKKMCRTDLSGGHKMRVDRMQSLFFHDLSGAKSDTVKLR